MKFLFSIITLSSIWVCCSFAQTVVWALQPGNYNRIERLGNGLFCVSRYGKIGLVRPDGSIVASVENDTILGYYEHTALLIKHDGRGECISGSLTDNGVFNSFRQKFYTLEGQKFYSDGLLSVSDADGAIGYIDLQGNKVLGFDGKYNRIKPFSEGYAAVRKGKKYVLIDKESNEQYFQYDGNGVVGIGGCTNVYNGKAYVYDEYGENYYTYDAASHGKLKKVRKPSNRSMDYLFCYQDVTDRGKSVPFVKLMPRTGKTTAMPVQGNGLWGYREAGKQILIPQFSQASAFEDGVAVVSTSLGKGLLRLVSGNFSCSAAQNSYTFHSGQSVQCAFSVEMPSVWTNKDVSLTLTSTDGVNLPVVSRNGNYSFDYTPASSGQRDFTLQIKSQGLVLYEGTLSYTFNKKVIVKYCPTCHKPITECQYGGKHPVPPRQSSSDKHPKIKKCPTCHKPINECEYEGVHP